MAPHMFLSERRHSSNAGQIQGQLLLISYFEIIKYIIFIYEIQAKYESIYILKFFNEMYQIGFSISYLCSREGSKI